VGGLGYGRGQGRRAGRQPCTLFGSSSSLSKYVQDWALATSAAEGRVGLRGLTRVWKSGSNSGRGSVWWRDRGRRPGCGKHQAGAGRRRGRSWLWAGLECSGRGKQGAEIRSAAGEVGLDQTLNGPGIG
jgi:hypothetical protein